MFVEIVIVISPTIQGAFTHNEMQPDIFTLKNGTLFSLALCQWWRTE